MLHLIQLFHERLRIVPRHTVHRMPIGVVRDFGALEYGWIFTHHFLVFGLCDLVAADVVRLVDRCREAGDERVLPQLLGRRVLIGCPRETAATATACGAATTCARRTC